MKTLVWTDGSCNAKGVAGRGGWAALIERDGSTEQLVGSAVETTHNRMELTAVCEALEIVDGAIEVRTDSTYIEKCFNEGWHIPWRRDDKWRTRKGAVKNRDLWERLFALVEDDARDVSFVWVEGHGDEANNNIVDRLSREASKSHPEVPLSRTSRTPALVDDPAPRPRVRRARPAPAWRSLPPAEMAAHLLATPTIADGAWTAESRVRGESRADFVVRILGPAAPAA